jgi:hypothetical protein
MFGGVLEWRPRPTPGCSAIEEKEDEFLVGSGVEKLSVATSRTGIIRKRK